MSATFEIPDWMITPASPPAAPDLSDVDPHRVEGLVNRFIAAKQDALYDAPDAFYRHEGADALLRVPFVRNRLIGLKGRLLDMPWSDFPPSSSKEEPIVQLLPYHPRPSWEQEPIAQLLPAYPGQLDQSALQDFRVPLTGGERAVLGERLDAHIADAMDGIDRHAAAQRDVLTRQTIGERQALIQRAAELDHNNDDKLTGLADAHASAAQELARMNGEPEGPATEAARSTIWRTAAGQRLATGNAAQAVALFGRVKDQIAPADRRHLELPLQLAVTDIAADRWIERQAGQPGEPLPSRVAADLYLSPAEKASVLTKIAERNPTTESARVATVKGLDDELDATRRALATTPAAHKPGTFVALANAYDDAAEPDKAVAARRLAEQENVLGRFAKSSVDEQQRVIGSLPEDAQEAAKAIQRQQTEAFAKDAFAAGTALHPDVGQPVPIDDIEGRIRQARRIAHLRGVPVAPFTADESSAMRRQLSSGTPQEREAVFNRVNALPNDVKAAAGHVIAPVQTPGEFASDVPSFDDATHREGASLAEATPDDFRPLGPQETDPNVEGRRGTFFSEPAPHDPDIEAAYQKDPGTQVVRRDGTYIPDPKSPTGHVMAPFNDLKSVAAAGREIRRRLIETGITTWSKAEVMKEAKALMKHYVGQGGVFDYQRRAYEYGKDGFTQLPQFRNISNINVGLICQQTGFLTLDDTLKTAGEYAREHSSNYRPDQPYGLDPDTQKYIEVGFDIGQRNMFRDPKAPPRRAEEGP